MGLTHTLTHKIISIHTLRVEGDHIACGQPITAEEFLSTPSVWRVTIDYAIIIYDQDIFLSTPSVWRVTGFLRPVFAGRPISIHTLRVEGDPPACPADYVPSPISIHTLRVEGDGGFVLP